MDRSTITPELAKNLLDAQAHIWNHIFSFLNSMALKCALELGIPDAIKSHGKPMSLNELAMSLSIHPTKAPSLQRLMRLLCHSNFFSMNNLPNGESSFDLTINSHLLLKEHPFTIAPLTLFLLDPSMMDPAQFLSSWLKNEEETPFHIAHGRSIWDQTVLVEKFSDELNEALFNDSRLVGSLLVGNDKLKGLFEGIESLVDVGGANGILAKAIAEAYPGLKCIVFDRPHVIEGLQQENDTHNMTYVGGDMFVAIPPANAVLLKWVLHDWSDENCVKILKLCKAAIPNKDKGGKVIIVDMVVEEQNYGKEQLATQYLFDIKSMCITIGGKQRTEDEWKEVFVNAGFDDYKIFSALGIRSVIVVYPH